MNSGVPPWPVCLLVGQGGSILGEMENLRAPRASHYSRRAWLPKGSHRDGAPA